MSGLEENSPKHQRVFISYSHDSGDHVRRVRALADQLRKDGIDARIDQYTPDPDEGWSKWMRTQVKEADKVLLAFTESYQKRYERDEEQGKGPGAGFEGVVVTQSLYERGGSDAKFRPMVFHEEDERFIPVELRRFNRYRVDTHDNYEDLLRWLYQAPAIIPPTIGNKPTLPPEPAPELVPDPSGKGHDAPKSLHGDLSSTLATSARVDTSPAVRESMNPIVWIDDENEPDRPLKLNNNYSLKIRMSDRYLKNLLPDGVGRVPKSGIPPGGLSTDWIVKPMRPWWRFWPKHSGCPEPP
jgi:hypothetical protein